MASSPFLLPSLLFLSFMLSFVSGWSPPSYDMRFIDQPLLKGLDKPLGVEYARDGSLYFWQKSGRVFVKLRNHPTPILLINLEKETSDIGDRGLLGFTLDPQFHTNGYFYLLYTVLPQQNSFALDTWTWSRVTRYQASISSNRTKLVAGSRKVLLGNTKEDGIPVCSIAHSVGTLKFGHDGKLYISHGDGSAFDRPDWGGDYQCGAMFGDQDIGSFRAQVTYSMAGKILRIDPRTGLGLTDNPFYVKGAPLSAPSSRIWAVGLRNPFRMELKPKDATGATIFFVCDNGAATWEEITIVKKGTNAGWPCYEGPAVNNDFKDNTHYCGANQMPGTLIKPQMYWHHWDGTLSRPQGLIGASSTGIAFYQGTTYPAAYRKETNGGLLTFFFCDYANNWMKAAFINAQNQIVGFSDFFATPNPVFIGTSPYANSGEIFYVSLYDDSINLIHYSQSSVPIVQISSNTTAPGLNRAIQFSSDGTYDPGNGRLTLLWKFGDGTTSSLPNPTHKYTKKGNFTVSLTVKNTLGKTTTAYRKVTTWVSSPLVSKPSVPARYNAGDKITPTSWHSPGTKLFWDLQLLHQGHFHPETATSLANSPTFTLDTDTNLAGERFSYRLVVTATDSLGNKASSQASLWGYKTDTNANRPAIPAFEIVPAAPKANQAVLFNAAGSIDPDGDFMEYSWNFGDKSGPGSSRDQPQTRHIFPFPGWYTVRLGVWETFGTTTYISKNIYVNPSNMIGAWLFDENTGTVSNDYSSNGATVSLVNTDWVYVGSPSSVSCIQLTRSKKSFAVIKATPLLDRLTTGLSISFLFQPWFSGEESGLSTWVRILSKKASATDTTGFEVLYNPALSSLGVFGNRKVATSKTGSVPRWKWATVIITISTTGTVKFKVNSVDVSSQTSIAGAIKPNSLPLIIGKAAWNTGYFNGMIDNLKIHDT